MMGNQKYEFVILELQYKSSRSTKTKKLFQLEVMAIKKKENIRFVILQKN